MPFYCIRSFMVSCSHDDDIFEARKPKMLAFGCTQSRGRKLRQTAS